MYGALNRAAVKSERTTDQHIVPSRFPRSNADGLSELDIVYLHR
jgi:hypothetical protein